MPRRIVLDAGPLIALVHERDHDHGLAVAGFQQLAAQRAHLLAPLPIVFEVYKWVLYNEGAAAARAALGVLQESLELTFPGRTDLEGIVQVVNALSDWGGTLEDALVAVTALRLRLPVWTLNYRDFAAFPRLRFWTPDGPQC